MSGNKTVVIKACPRIHITLINMNRNGLRINGGIGFSIKSPQIEIGITSSQHFKIQDRRQVPIDSDQLGRLTQKIDLIKKKLNLNYNIELTVDGELPVHSGFGSGTILRLASIEGLLIVNDIQYEEIDLVKMSGRGGTSGIGIRTYFNGGYVFDIGQKNIGQKLLPSSKNENNTNQTLLLSEGNLPKWKFGICFPLKSLKEESEEVFFSKSTSIPNESIYKTLYHVVYEVLGGIKESDKRAFETGIKELQLCDWKKSERNLYPDILANAESILYANGASMVGMSSLGPGLFFWGDDIDNIIFRSKEELSDWYYCRTVGNNEGRIITIKDA